MHGLSRAAVRLTIEAAFLALVAVGAVLAGFEPVVIVAMVAGAAVLVAVVERAYVRQAARSAASPPEEAPAEEIAAPGHPDVVDAGPEAEPVGQPEPRKEPELAVSERSARAILASGPPPIHEAPRPIPASEPEPKPEPLPDTGPATLDSDLPYEWNVWDLQRLVRDRPDDDRQEEWAAIIVSLRDFARADGTLPREFDELVRDSFGELLAEESARTEAAAAW
ncbi:MAG: hypothetical protein ACRDNH_08055 [Gaiellaceae bacterium]